MKRFVCLILSVFVLYGCSLRPKGVMSEKKMEAVLYDMHLAEGIVPSMGYNGPQKDDQDACFRYVLEKHHITQAEFDSSIVWYTAHPKRFDKIYPKVIKRFEHNLQITIDEQTREKEISLLSGKPTRKKTAVNIDSLLRATTLPHPTIWQQTQDSLMQTRHIQPPLN